jgi:hypothetical protein
MRPTAAISLALTLAGWVVQPARAESPVAPCTRSISVFPAEETSIPANAPAIVFGAPDIVPARSIDDFELRLEGPDGNPVPFTIEKESDQAYLVRFAQELAQGRHVLRYRDHCYQPGPLEQEHSFTAEAPSPLPTTLGEVVITPGDLLGASCSPYDATGVVDLAAPPPLDAYRNLTRVRALWNGLIAHLDVGGSQWFEGHLRIGVPIRCGQERQNESGRLELSIEIAGASSQPPPLVGEFSVPCPIPLEKAPPSCSQGQDAGAPGGSVDARSGKPPKPAPAPRSGCSLGSAGGPRSSALLLVLLGCAFARAGRRRRGRS